MPVKAKGPDGKTYSFPDGTSKEDIIDYFAYDDNAQKPSSIFPQGTSVESVATDVATASRNRPKDDRPAVTLRNLMQSIGQGASLGWSDEITSSMAAGLAKLLQDKDYSDAYEDIIYEQRKEGKEFRKNYPGLDFGIQLTSGILTGKPIVKGTQKVLGSTIGALPGAKAISRVSPSATSLGRMSAESGVIGGIAGAGYEDSHSGDTMLKGAGEGALVGAALGATVPTAAAVIKKLAETGGKSLAVIGNMAGIGSGDYIAKRRLLEAISKDKTTPEALLSEIQQKSQQGFPVSLIDIAGPNLLNLSQRTIKRSGMSYAPLVEGQQQRLSEIPDRAREVLKQDLVLSNPDLPDYSTYKGTLSDELNNAQDYLTKSFTTQKTPLRPDIQGKFIDLLAKDPDTKEAWRVARQMTKGRTDIKLNKDDPGITELYYLKRGFDSLAASRRKPGFDPEIVNRLNDKSERLDNLLRYHSDDYQNVSDKMSSLSREMSALEEGAQIHSSKTSPEEFSTYFSNLAEQEKNAYLAGVRESSLREMGKNKDLASLTSPIFGKEGSDLRERMKTLYEPEHLGNMLNRFKTYDEMIAGAKSIQPLAMTNPISAVLDPESQDVRALLGAGTAGLAGALFGNIPIASIAGLYGTSRLIPSQAASRIAEASYGPLTEAQRFLKPMTKGLPGQTLSNLQRAFGRQMPAQTTYGLSPHLFAEEEPFEDPYPGY